MKIAIHNKPGSFSDHWIEYCIKEKIPFKLVNCYDSDIIKQIDKFDGLMWHWDQTDYKTTLFARQLTNALELKGIKVFPNRITSWHYDDKVGQKYLLEAIDAPLIRSYVFYSKRDALKWAENTTFPKVFKLKGGSGSANVRIVKNRHKAKHLINKAFGKGFSHVNSFDRLKNRFWILKRDKNFMAIKKIFTGFVRIFISTIDERLRPKDKGYIYFQDFIPGNKFDTRLVIIGDRCFGMRRFCRKDDFRASGSGLKDYNHKLINLDCVKLAFSIAQKLNMQSIAFDFVVQDKTFKLIEISYSFESISFPGYWDSNLFWHNGEVCPQKFMIKDFIKNIKSYHRLENIHMKKSYITNCS